MKFRKQTGSSLIEVLVTALILAIGLLGLAALQSRSLQYNQGAALRSQANILASDIIDRMRINHAVALTGVYNTEYETTHATGATLVAKDLHEWKDLLSTSLPSGDGSVDCAADALCTVRVRWHERNRDENTDNDTPELSEFVYTTRL